MFMAMSNSVSPVIQLSQEAEEDAQVILPDLEGYSSFLIKNNTFSLFNFGTKYFVIDIGPREFNNGNGDSSNLIFKGKQSLSFFGACPCDIFVQDNNQRLVFRVSFLTSSKYFFPVLKGIHVTDRQGTTIGSVWRPGGCTCNDFVLKDSVIKNCFYAASKFNFCEGPDFIIKDTDGQIVSKVYRKGHQFVLRFGTNTIVPTSTKIMILAFCLYLEVRGNLRFSNGCMKP